MADGGRFISITFAQPHFRKRILCRAEYDWGDLRIDTFGDGFHFYFYVLTRGRPLLEEPPYGSVEEEEEHLAVTFVEDENFLGNIQM